MNKYRNKRITIDGIKFDSIAEGRRYKELKLLQQGNYITDLKLQPKFELQPKYINNKGEKVRAITYKADFSYLERIESPFETKDVIECLVVEDVKGVITKEFAIKKKIFEYKYPNIDFRIIK